MTTANYIDRPPRIQPDLPQAKVEIPSPPESLDTSRAALLQQVALPLLTVVGFIMIAFLGGQSANRLLIVPMVLSVIASTVFSWYSYSQDRQRKKAELAAYNGRLAELRQELAHYHEAQRLFYTYNYPSTETVLRIVQDTVCEPAEQEATIRSGTRLWERRPADDDFGVLRIGIGTRPSTVVYQLSQAETFNNPLIQDAARLAEDSEYVSQAPITIPLRRPPPQQDESEADVTEDEQPTQTIHALGVAGAPACVHQFARALLVHYTTFHSPHDAQLYVIGSSREPWQWLTDLAHTQADDHTEKLCFLDEQNSIGVSPLDSQPRLYETGLSKYLEELRRVLVQRKIRLNDSERDEQDDPTRPFLLVVVDLLGQAPEDSPFANLESDATVAILQREGAELGAAVIFLVPQRSKVPGNCIGVVEVEAGKRVDEANLVFRYAETGVNTLRYVGEADAITDPDILNTYTNILKQWDVRKDDGAALTKIVPFLEMLGESSLQSLRQTAVSNWERSVQPKHAGALQARIGYMAGNKPRTLIFSAKRDGVHGMVAGSTGSGKSELLISILADLAGNYDPSILNFVLVDYKGGGAFQDFANLPHCVDVITNLQRSGVTRMFTSINAELKRRQKLNVSTDTKDIVEYHSRGYHLAREPYPYLFIIIDEFAEMIADNKHFRSELETITRLGRAQGVSLLLAAQRPTGITDQMRSNIKFRICLRVETPGESREMLRQSDAAYLPGSIPGRGYLQVGNDEIDLIQVAYTGERYLDPTLPAVPNVIWLDRKSNTLNGAAKEKEPPKLYQAIVDMVTGVAESAGCAIQRAPWPDPLPAAGELTLTTPLASTEYLVNVDAITQGKIVSEPVVLNPFLLQWLNNSGGWTGVNWQDQAMRPVVGLIDNPYEAQQLPLAINLYRDHVAIFGASGWGKSVFLRVLVASLASSHSPDEVHVYVLDLGGRSLTVLEALPHVGTVILPDEEGYVERVEYLLRELQNIVEKRKGLFSRTGVEDLYHYNSQHSEQPEPAILVIVDNFVEFVETFGTSKDNVESTLDRFTALVRQSRPYGVHFVITANSVGTLSNKLYSLFTERLTLKLTDPVDYRAILGAGVAEPDEIEGRGYVKSDGKALAMQIALIARQDDNYGVVTDLNVIRQLAAAMKQYGSWRGDGPMEMGALPRTSSFIQLLANTTGLRLDDTYYAQLQQKTRSLWQQSLLPDFADWLSVTLGIVSGNQPRPLHFSATRDGVHGMVAGGTGSGKSELLMTLIVSMALKYDPGILNFVLVDYKGGGAFKPFETLPHCVDIITNLNSAGVTRMFTAINAEIKRRQQLNADTGVADIIEYRRRGLHLSQQPYPHLFIVIDEYAEMIVDKPEFKEELDRITRVGRSLGISLILASQKPTGVSDQMRANIKFRLCLRVEGVDTSREMLRRSDAAFLPNGMPGRGYLQVGNDNLELIQIAYVGEPFPFPHTGGEDTPKFYEAAVALARALAAEFPERQPKRPWPAVLPDGKAEFLCLQSQIDPDYLRPDAITQITQGQMADNTPLTLNHFVAKWLGQEGTWPGIDWSKYAMRPVVGLIDNPYAASQMPLVLNLARGHLVLFGGSSTGKTVLLRTTIASLVTTHAPGEVHIYILDLGGRQLTNLRDLPHVGAVITPDEAGYEERVQQLLRELNRIIEDRKRTLGEVGASDLYQYNARYAAEPLPAILVMVDNFSEFRESLGDLESTADAIFGELLTIARQARAYGVHFVLTANHLSAVPAKLLALFTERLTLRLQDSSAYREIVGADIADIEDVKGRGYIRVDQRSLECQVATFLPVDSGDSQWGLANEKEALKQLVATMRSISWSGEAPVPVESLPKTSSYKLLLRQIHSFDPESPFLDELRRQAKVNWRESVKVEQSDWLAVTLGVGSGNKPLRLCFSAKADGVHGLIAGGTGAGKSELLTTLIAGMALCYDPSVLNFVLVDYKGGGAFQPFVALPHCVDIITNLNGAAVVRMFTAIGAEIRRRQQLNAEMGVKDIVDYRRKGYHLTKEPYPHLFIIIDEYAEMIADNREYLQKLESITRVGRSLGISLILASQRPTGVTDQMRSNIKFRICLRVEGVDESRELLRRPDAAYLPSGMPGRGYLQVGNEELQLIQVSYTGEPLLEARQPEDAEPPKLFEVIVKMARELAEAVDAPERRPRPWPPFLPHMLALQDVLSGEYLAHRETAVSQLDGDVVLNPYLASWIAGDNHAWPQVGWHEQAMRVDLGLVDNPYEASQLLLTLDLARDHHVLFGGSGWGKTTFLRTMMVQLACWHSPAALHMYVLDLGGRNFSDLKHLPHVGDVIMLDDEAYEERVIRLLEKLNRIVDERKQVLNDADVRDLPAYNRVHDSVPLPPILVLIDNFAELKENFESLLDTTLIPLMRQSRTYGVYFFITATEPGAISSKVYGLLGQRFTLPLPDPTRYLDIVGRGATDLESIPGRGLIKVGLRPLVFQVALPLRLQNSGGNVQSEGAQLRRLARNMQQVWPGSVPEPVHILPKSVSLREEVLPMLGAADKRRIEAALGIDNELRPALVDLQAYGPHFAIVGPPLSGKTTVLFNWVLSLADRYSPHQVRMVLVDLQQKFVRYGGERSLDEVPHIITTVTDTEQLERFVAQLRSECQVLVDEIPGYRLFVVIENFDDFIEEVEGNRETAGIIDDLGLLARRYGTYGLHFILAGALDGPSSLKKRVLASNYGLGLRDADSLTTLKAYARGVKDMPTGRGFIVNAGHLLKVQIARPFENEEEKGRLLDNWIQEINRRYAGADRAGWSRSSIAPAAVVSEPEPVPVDAQVADRTYELLKQAVVQQSQANGVSLAELGISLDEMPEQDVLRMAGEYFPVND